MQLNKGAKVRVVQAIDLNPYAVLEAGEKGEVIDVADDGPAGPSATIRLEKTHDGLKPWDNTAYLVQPELSYIAPVKKAWSTVQEFVLATIASVTVVGLAKAHAIHAVWGLATTLLASIDFL